MNKISGIYGIRSLVHPERIYIGSSTNIHKRWSQHRSHLRKGIHHNAKLQSHYNKYTESDLIFEIIIRCDKGVIIVAEQVFMDRFKPWFNVRLMADNNFGIKHTPETNQKNREKQLGKHPSEETRRKLSQALRERPRSKETCSKISKSLTGKHPSEETREKLRASHVGQKNRAKLTINIETGIFYDSARDAAKSVGKSTSWMHRRLSGKIKNTTFKYV